MTFYFDKKSSRLMTALLGGPITKSTAVTGGKMPVRLGFAEARNLVVLPRINQRIWLGVSTKEGLLLALTQSWSFDRETRLYEGMLDFRTEEVASLFEDGAESVECFMQAVWEGGGQGPFPSQVIPLILRRSVVNFDDDTPSILPSPEQWMIEWFADRPALATIDTGDTFLVGDASDEGRPKWAGLAAVWNWISSQFSNLGFVSYEAPQILSNEQKEQARENIGAAETVDTSGFQVVIEKGQPSGYASLDELGKVPLEELPEAILGAMSFQGVWNAATNSPSLNDDPHDNRGEFYIIGTAGSTDLSGITDWKIGDWVVGLGDGAWAKIDSTDQVTSVAGLQGAISASGLKTALAIAATDITNFSTGVTNTLVGYPTGVGAMGDSEFVQVFSPANVPYRTTFSWFKSTLKTYFDGLYLAAAANAASASVLQTARQINGVAFNGSANIVVPSGPTAIVTESTTTRVLALSDAGKYIRLTNPAETTITVPANASVNWAAAAVPPVIYFRIADEIPPVIDGSGVTFNGVAKIAGLGQHDTFALQWVANDVWDVI